MAATFPKGIKSFPTHRNLLDDVRAEHINTIQEEVVAIESVLGPLVNQVSEIRSDVDQIRAEVDSLTTQMKTVESTLRSLQSQIDAHTVSLNNLQSQIIAHTVAINDLQDQIDALEAGQEALRDQLEQQQQDIIDLRQTDQNQWAAIDELREGLIEERELSEDEYATLQQRITKLQWDLDDQKKMVTVQFANVAERLNYMSEGKHIYAVTVARNKDLGIKKAANGGGGLPNKDQQTAVLMEKAVQDPMGMYNNVGITLPVAGFWHIQGYCRISTGGGPAKAEGVYYAEVFAAGKGSGKAADRYFVDNTVRNNVNDVNLSPTLIGWFPAGTTLTLYVSHSANQKQTLTHATMSAYRVRGY